MGRSHHVAASSRCLTLIASLLLSGSTSSVLAVSSSSSSSSSLFSTSSGKKNKDDDTVPSWDELDNRATPEWYGQAKFGIFLHWGVFSVPSLCSEWIGSYWRDHWGPCSYLEDILNQTERPGLAYQEFASRFQAELYNATEWSRIFAHAGAQYVVLTSKHHEGYCLWDSRNVPATWQWNVMDVGPRRDLLGELAQAVKVTDSPHTGQRLKFGVYHSLYEWFNPFYQQDKDRNFTTNDFVTLKTLAELRDLVEKYQPELIWSDGEWEAPSDYWQARQFLQWYAAQVATGVWNDRWGTDTLCHHGDFLTCTDRYNPGHVVHRKWENAMTIDQTSWGFNRASPFENYLSTESLVHSLIETVAFNGNLLLNVGPAADGTLPAIFVDRLHSLGDWLSVNGAAIYDTAPWDVCQTENATSSSSSEVVVMYYTRTKDALYAHMTSWPAGNSLHLTAPQPTPDTVITLLGYSSSNNNNDDSAGATWSASSASSLQTKDGGMVVRLPPLTPNLIPCQHAWVLQLSHIANLDTDNSKDHHQTTMSWLRKAP